MKYKLQILRLDNCNIEKSSDVHFIRFFKSQNFQPMKILSLKGNKIGDGMAEEIFNCLIERIEKQQLSKKFANPVKHIDLSNNSLTS